MKGKRPEIGDGKPANTAFCRGQNGEMKRQDSASPGGRQESRFSLLSFCRLISEGKMKGQAAGSVLKRKCGGVCPFVVSWLACASRALAHAYYKGLKNEGLKFKGKSILFSFRKERTKGQEEIKDESLELKGSDLRGDCVFVLSQNSNENKGQKDKGEIKGYGLKIKEVAGAVLVWIYAGIFGLVFWSVLFACWWLGGAL